MLLLIQQTLLSAKDKIVASATLTFKQKTEMSAVLFIFAPN